MRPEIRDLGGHSEFVRYRQWFRERYARPDRPIFDVLGRRVLFDQEPLLDDCAHVCYGGLAGQAYNPQFWHQDRAIRIAWIEQALTQPNKIHPDKDYADRQKYLLFLPPDDHTQQQNEFYCVIVRVLGRRAVGFLTAYPIVQNAFDEYQKVGPRIYPPMRPKKRR